MNRFPLRQTTNEMTLRFQFPKLQLLSAAFAATVLFGAPRAAFSQAPAAPGQDYILMKPAATPSQPVQLVNVLITGVRGSKMTVRNAQGEIAYDLASVTEIRKLPPPEFVQGQKLIEGGDLEKGASPDQVRLGSLQGIADDMGKRCRVHGRQSLHQPRETSGGRGGVR